MRNLSTARPKDGRLRHRHFPTAIVSPSGAQLRLTR
jgi:hypothetical protein